MFAIVICLVLLMCTLTFKVICINGQGMSAVVYVTLSIMSVMSPPPALCSLSVRTVVKLYTLGVYALWMSLVS